MTALIQGMYSEASRDASSASRHGSEFNRQVGPFGIECGQMRPTYHPCPTCGKSTFSLAKDRCACEIKQTNCRQLVHNGGWYNKAGQKIGWGDLCDHDLLRIAAETKEPFLILGESDSYWNFYQRQNRVGVPCDAHEGAPGIQYVMAHLRMVAVPGKVYVISDDKAGRFQRGALEAVYTPLHLLPELR